jgi:hypothetical protein
MVNCAIRMLQNRKASVFKDNVPLMQPVTGQLNPTEIPCSKMKKGLPFPSRNQPIV